ncbi:hypothetical protein GCM10023310_38590 [Paenibacillus vulneris]|nr:hypothetical protein [Paenibacillus sp. 32352]
MDNDGHDVSLLLETVVDVADQKILDWLLLIEWTASICKGEDYVWLS